jgi:tRNA A-37 threonylcarbamoyl transferase component Bud32
VDREELAGVVRAAFGPARRLADVQRLRGGSKKGVYRLTLDNGSTVVGYVWAAEENYWPAPVTGGADPFADASGADLFEASHARLATLGVRTPQVYLLDRSLTAYPAEVALVEVVPGGTLQTLARLGAALAVMHRQRDRRIGKVALVDRGAAPQDRPCEQVVLDRALDHLAQAASRVERVAAVRSRLEDVTRELAAAVRPRTEHGLIHGELGPDHVLVDSRGHPVLIDIEGVMFFDTEWEHAFAELRFGEHYRWLRQDGLDDRRLRFYRLALHLSLIAGPLRLLDGDFPDREPMMRIVAFNVEQARAFADP